METLFTSVFALKMVTSDILHDWTLADLDHIVQKASEAANYNDLMMVIALLTTKLRHGHYLAYLQGLMKHCREGTATQDEIYALFHHCIETFLRPKTYVPQAILAPSRSGKDHSR